MLATPSDLFTSRQLSTFHLTLEVGFGFTATNALECIGAKSEGFLTLHFDDTTSSNSA